MEFQQALTGEIRVLSLLLRTRLLAGLAGHSLPSVLSKEPTLSRLAHSHPSQNSNKFLATPAATDAAVDGHTKLLTTGNLTMLSQRMHTHTLLEPEILEHASKHLLFQQMLALPDTSL